MNKCSADPCSRRAIVRLDGVSFCGGCAERYDELTDGLEKIDNPVVRDRWRGAIKSEFGG